MSRVRERIKRLKEKIEELLTSSGREGERVLILGATKGVPAQKIAEAYEEGIRIFGENRVQEALRKIPLLSHLDIEWHMIGHLQLNKVKKALNLFHVIESVDRKELIDELVKRLKGRNLEIMVEVNTSFEPQKYGVSPEGLFELLEYTLQFPELKVIGLMTLGPYPPEERKSRRAFALLRKLKEEAEKRFGIHFPHLSMGMTEDFEWAIMEGATIVRIGRGIFGEREE